jgi:hypothetical protein
MIDVLVTRERRECVDRGRILGYSMLGDGLMASHIVGRDDKTADPGAEMIIMRMPRDIR